MSQVSTRDQDSRIRLRAPTERHRDRIHAAIFASLLRPRRAPRGLGHPYCCDDLSPPHLHHRWRPPRSPSRSASPDGIPYTKGCSLLRGPPLSHRRDRHLVDVSHRAPPCLRLRSRRVTPPNLLPHRSPVGPDLPLAPRL